MFNYSPKVVKDGLVLCLDATNPKSYSPNAFPYPLDIYAYTGPNANQATITRDYTIDASPAGGVPLKMAVTGTDPYTVSYNSLTYSFATAAQGQTWNVSGWIKASANTTANFYIFGANSSGGWIEIAGDTFSVTTSWQRFQTAITFTNASTTSIQVRLDGPDSGGAGINIWWDGLQAEKAQSATAFNHRYNQNAATWKDLSNVIGDVNVNNRNNDWSFVTDTTNGKLCLYNTTLRTSSSGINIPVNNGFNKLEGTIEMWLKPTSHTGAQGWFTNSDGVTYTNASNWFWLGGYDASSILYLRQGNPSTCCNDVTVNSFASSYYQLNTWNFWTITWKVSSGTAAIYRNSVLLSQRTNLPTDIPNTNPTNTGQLFNGHSYGDNTQFLGYCNLYKIYNRALTTNEIVQNYNAHKSRFNI